jgi:hypothetical protein
VSEELPKVTLSVPHDRIRTLVIDENQLITTSQGSSFLYFVRAADQQPSHESSLFKLYEPS